MTTDPTMDLIRSLDDPTQFRRVDRVAVFKPHRRVCPDGTVIDVTDADLPEIASNVNRTYELDGELVRLVIGHRQQAPGFPEPLQPLVVGYARNYRAELVERPGGQALRLTHTEYVRREHENEAGKYPGRSPEYDPVSKTITAVALLTRDPFLTLGTVAYEAGDVDPVAEVRAAVQAFKDARNPHKPPTDYGRVMQHMRANPGVSYQAAEAAVAAGE
jgi:hypothetical protein